MEDILRLIADAQHALEEVMDAASDILPFAENDQVSVKDDQVSIQDMQPQKVVQEESVNEIEDYMEELWGYVVSTDPKDAINVLVQDKVDRYLPSSSSQRSELAKYRNLRIARRQFSILRASVDPDQLYTRRYVYDERITERPEGSMLAGHREAGSIARAMADMDIRTDRQKLLDLLTDRFRPNIHKEKKVPCALSKLPPEVRRKIFNMDVLYRDRRCRNPSLLKALRPEKAMYKEALEIYYRINFAMVGMHTRGARNLSDLIKKDNMDLVRKMVAVIPDRDRSGVTNVYDKFDPYALGQHYFLEVGLATNLTRLVLISRGNATLLPANVFIPGTMKQLKSVELIWANLAEFALVETIEAFNETFRTLGKMKRVRKADKWGWPDAEEWFWAIEGGA